ncbi:MAG TPA: NAD-dependent epimerase/dehydratase family protein [Thermoleophilaceae bacterium]|nr:NAD-dependent epimerase/dehydratase family protein [Thermoleophilaceae bacterium]
MKAFVTGGTGFIGGRLVRKLRERGDDVVALVRSPDKALELERLGVELVKGDLTDVDAIRRGTEGADGVFHGAAIYKVGIPKAQREDMYETNVRGTERVLDCATQAGVPKIVYVSTVNVFGNTKGEVVDESYKRPGNDFLSYYDETKYESHQVALDRIGKGAPIVVVQPGGVYGPGDHSEIGNMIDQASKGKLFAYMFPETGFNLVHVDDVADGTILAFDRGEAGQSYVLGGEISTMRTLVDKTSEIAGRKPPKRDLPVGLLKAVAPAGPVIGKIMGFPPNFRELITVSDGVTYWATDDKARERLGYAPRDLDTGLRQTLAAAG